MRSRRPRKGDSTTRSSPSRPRTAPSRRTRTPPGTTAEKLAELPTVFKSDGTVTPGNASQISDGAAALLVTSETFADEHGLEILAEVGSNNVAGVDPTVMGIGPVPATRGLLERTGREIDDYDLVELNEAFASQAIYSRDELGIDPDVFNVNGGAIAIGHPLGASGASPGDADPRTRKARRRPRTGDALCRLRPGRRSNST